MSTIKKEQHEMLERAASVHGETWAGWICKSIIENNDSGLRGDGLSDALNNARLSFVKTQPFTRYFQQIKTMDDKFVLTNFHTIMGLYFKQRFLETVHADIELLKRTWETVVMEEKNKRVMEMNKKVPSLQGMTFNSLCSPQGGSNKMKLVKDKMKLVIKKRNLSNKGDGETLNIDRSVDQEKEGPKQKKQRQFNTQFNLMPKKTNLSEWHCENYLTCGTGYQSLIYKHPKEALKKKGKLSKYNQLKFDEFEKYWGESILSSAYNMQVYFKKCGAATSEPEVSSSDLFPNEKFKSDMYPSIDLDRSAYSKKLLKKLDGCQWGRKMYPCPICFKIGVQKANPQLGHSLNLTKTSLFYGFAYALQCGVQKIFHNGTRSDVLKKIGTKYAWTNEGVAADEFCDNQSVRCCDNCKRMRRDMKQGAKKEVKKYAYEANCFKEFEHLSISFGRKIALSDALATLCNLVNGGAQNKYTIGENITSIYLEENLKTNDLEVNVSINPSISLMKLESQVASNLAQVVNKSGAPVVVGLDGSNSSSLK